MTILRTDRLVAFGFGGLVLASAWNIVSGLRLADLVDLWSDPEVLHALVTCVVVGSLATLLATLATFLLLWARDRSVAARFFERSALVQLAIPHLTLAVGVAFLLAPSGWLARVVAATITGSTRPPAPPASEIDAYLLLMLVLVAKETPFLLLIARSRLRRIDAAAALRQAASLGYPPAEAWWKVIAPRLLGQMGLPILAIFAYAVSNIEVALIVGPSTPPPLPILVLGWHQDPHMVEQTKADAGACLLIITIGLVAIGVRRAHARLCRLWNQVLTAGHGARGLATLASLTSAASWAAIGLWCGALGMLAIWSFAGHWRFPALLPGGWSMRGWGTAFDANFRALPWTVAVACLTSLVAVALAVLVSSARRDQGKASSLQLFYLPLVLPQIALYLGFQGLLVEIGIDGTAMAVMLGHLLLVLPYALIVVSEAMDAIDPRFDSLATSLGRSPVQVLLTVRIPQLRAALALALAIGIAVSTALYVPTLLLGAGRVSTLALDLVPLAQGGDRRIAAAVGTMLSLLPLSALIGARILGRSRLRGMP